MYTTFLGSFSDLSYYLMLLTGQYFYCCHIIYFTFYRFDDQHLKPLTYWVCNITLYFMWGQWRFYTLYTEQIILRILEQAIVTLLFSNNWWVFITEVEVVYYAVRTESLIYVIRGATGIEAQDRDRWRTRVNTVMNLRVP